MVNILGSNELLEDVHKRDLCIGCGACVDICPYFKNYKGKTAQLFPCTLEQGRCYAYCPKAEVDLDALTQRVRGVPYDGSPLGFYREVLAARAGKKLLNGVFQGGGTVSALVTFALQTGLIDAAAHRDGLEGCCRICHFKIHGFANLVLGKSGRAAGPPAHRCRRNPLSDGGRSPDA